AFSFQLLGRKKLSFLKRIFGGGSKDNAAPVERIVGEPVEYKGFTIRATPLKEQGQFQTSGVISKEIDGVMQEHRFIRADRFTGEDIAAEQAMRKACQIIDEQGERIFS